MDIDDLLNKIGITTVILVISILGAAAGFFLPLAAALGVAVAGIIGPPFLSFLVLRAEPNPGSAGIGLLILSVIIGALFTVPLLIGVTIKLLVA